MVYTRREVGRIALAAGAALQLKGAPKPDSKFNGVQIGAITYSYRQLPNSNDAKTVLQYVLDSNISAIELMGPVAESFAGAPATGRGGFGGGQGRPRRWRKGPECQRSAGRQSAAWSRRPGWTPRRETTPDTRTAGGAAESRARAEGVAALRFHGQIQRIPEDVQ